MAIDLLVRNGTIVTPDSTFKAAIGIDDGIIVAIGEETSMPEGTTVVDAKGLSVLPGLIDAHVHFREPGLEYKEDFNTGSQAAACGGITTVVDMPNVNPATADVDSFLLKKKHLEGKSYIDIAVLAVVIPTNQDDLKKLWKAGVIGYKVFLGETVGGIPAPNDGQLLDAWKVIAETGRRTCIHGEHRPIVSHLIEKLKAQGRKDPLAHVDSRPPISAVEAVMTAILYCKETGAKLHDLHEGCKEVIELIRETKAKGEVDVTCETGPHYLLLVAEDMKKKGNLMRMNPPIRYRGHQEALWEGLKDGTIDMLATDHSPHTVEEKSRKSIWDTIPGFPGVETNVPLILTQVNKGMLTLNEYARLQSENPAKVWQMYPKKGCIAVGSDGDLTLVDMNRTATLRAKKLHSKSKITPFDGWKVKGMPVYTIVRGNVVMKDGKIEGQPLGRIAYPVDHKPQRIRKSAPKAKTKRKPSAKTSRRKK
ncbi:MAG: allantoinase AllB [Nitrospinota bacterium]